MKLFRIYLVFLLIAVVYPVLGTPALEIDQERIYSASDISALWAAFGHPHEKSFDYYAYSNAIKAGVALTGHHQDGAFREAGLVIDPVSTDAYKVNFKDSVPGILSAVFLDDLSETLFMVFATSVPSRLQTPEPSSSAQHPFVPTEVDTDADTNADDAAVPPDTPPSVTREAFLAPLLHTDVLVVNLDLACLVSSGSKSLLASLPLLLSSDNNAEAHEATCVVHTTARISHTAPFESMKFCGAQSSVAVFAAKSCESSNSHFFLSLNSTPDSAEDLPPHAVFPIWSSPAVYYADFARFGVSARVVSVDSERVAFNFPQSPGNRWCLAHTTFANLERGDLSELSCTLANVDLIHPSSSTGPSSTARLPGHFLAVVELEDEGQGQGSSPENISSDASISIVIPNLIEDHHVPFTSSVASSQERITLIYSDKTNSFERVDYESVSSCQMLHASGVTGITSSAPGLLELDVVEAGGSCYDLSRLKLTAVKQEPPVKSPQQMGFITMVMLGVLGVLLLVAAFSIVVVSIEHYKSCERIAQVTYNFKPVSGSADGPVVSAPAAAPVGLHDTVPPHITYAPGASDIELSLRDSDDSNHMSLVVGMDVLAGASYCPSAPPLQALAPLASDLHLYEIRAPNGRMCSSSC